ncbi:bifunctional [glutamate--ammonia ligase]-adenylyl-L-tyrosine phosphorylase/[glutamate--ammonia-ligase] adenylyltransferase [Nitrosomonas sp.]|uniref:bifunctional [glutamate--ammonia ligase]-adenylyl-L-tyrosine phosphorylase/[glutamate--ammonia-ligase] adenylyltransferase n=1 Tax=Nitrosomonas sp. TaxID=42353 RepID=UPI00284AFAD0|nr:bifunctional [glutamate--ammonia ligase]-adenylyl-L-tyrosine phosphorylase/[glutamate--ammonia-ligase] adenylyltransferase [Nitrosomonas sp.]MDR4514739.1 bifunctional [glutamate--ammonia ligase]-adenylyl-L-tyrosine phosphorylase/[glutamate--ammonia-ligase] adenylyltransferase [Nitrosomonas sp.]
MNANTPIPPISFDQAISFSRYVQRIINCDPSQKDMLLKSAARPFEKAEMLDFLRCNTETSVHDESELNSILRKLRKLVISRLAIRDISGCADLSEVMSTMTDLAEISINFALRHHEKWLSVPERFGTPKRKSSSQSQQLLVVAMGKLGGRELNVSSDVDLIFVYPEDGETDGKKPISNHEFFTRLGRKLIASLNDYTVDGYVFRVDMRLRPHGECSPLTISFDMLNEYLQTQGREWERHAWIKGRVISENTATDDESKLMEQIVKPFVFRKYLDFGAYASMRSLHRQLRKEVERREMHDNIKLGPGGIREIEFITQVFQLIRGGHDVDLCIRPTLDVLQQLQRKQQLRFQTVTELVDAYRFLRRLEHRLQFLDDQQTQTLPKNPEDRQLIATAMGYTDYEGFLQQLDVHRMHVSHHFELILAAPKKSPTHDILSHLWHSQSENAAQKEAAASQLSTLGFDEPTKISERVQQFYQSHFYQQLPEPSQQKTRMLMPALIETIAGFPPAETTLERMLKLLEAISSQKSSPASYLTLLLEHPNTLPRVTKLVSISQWASDYLGRHPILLDELLRHREPNPLPNWKKLKIELASQLNHVNKPKSDVIGWQMDHLRHFQHAQVFQLLVTDLEGSLKLETLSDHLTALADLVLETVLTLAWNGLRKRHRDSPRFAIVGYGKLGGKELGYVSDLDIVFLYDDDHPDAAETYTKLAHSVNTWLTSQTSAGLLYATDLRLRPNGSSGLWVHSIEAFSQYQHTQAWIWEHQALTRARCVAGENDVAQAFESTRKDILCQQRDNRQLKQEILSMREKMRDAHPNRSALFDIKHDRGGIIDVEFIVQYLVLSYAHRHPELTGNIGNIALLKLAAELGLIASQSAENCRIAYREYRRTQHRQRLNSDGNLTGTSATDETLQALNRIETEQLSDHRLAVTALWNEVFGN